MTPEENVVYLADLRAKVRESTLPVAMAMGSHYKEHLTHVTLRRTTHPPGAWTDASPGAPPSWVTGKLARSVTVVPGRSGATRARSRVAPHTVYARVQEWGATISVRRRKFMHWVNDRGSWYKKQVTVPSRPYMRPARDEVVADGSLSAAAMKAFIAKVWG